MDELDWVDDENSSFEADETLWKRLESSRYKDGFKDGTVEGGERALQMGFNLGYKRSIKQLYQVAKVKGVLTNVIELMRADGVSHQKQNEMDTLRRELEEDWMAYVNHLKNADTPSISSLYPSARPVTSCADKIEVESCSVEDDISRTTEGSRCKSKPEIPLSADSTLCGSSSDMATPSEINFSSRTLAVDNSDVKAFPGTNKFSEKTDVARCSSLNKADDSGDSTVMAAADKLSASATLIEYKVPDTASTESASVAGMLNEDNRDPGDIISVLTCDLHRHADELDSFGRSLFEKYLPKLETLLRQWKTE